MQFPGHVVKCQVRGERGYTVSAEPGGHMGDRCQFVWMPSYFSQITTIIVFHPFSQNSAQMVCVPKCKKRCNIFSTFSF